MQVRLALELEASNKKRQQQACYFRITIFYWILLVFSSLKTQTFAARKFYFKRFFCSGHLNITYILHSLVTCIGSPGSASTESQGLCSVTHINLMRNLLSAPWRDVFFPTSFIIVLFHVHLINLMPGRSSLQASRVRIFPHPNTSGPAPTRARWKAGWPNNARTPE